MIIFCMTLESPSTSSTNGNGIFSDAKPRDRKTKLHTKPDRRFSAYSDGLGNEVLTAAISLKAVRLVC